jgi:hypothetical protein
MRNGIGLLAAALLAAGLLAGCGQAARPAASGPATTTSSSPPRSATAAPAGPASAAPSRPSAPPEFVPLSFTAISVTHWWVLGSLPCGTRDCPAIVTTTDGGASFRYLPAPGGRFGPGLTSPPAAGSIRFADASDGWVFGPALYVTHDGGRRWTAISMPGQVTGLEPGLGEVFSVVTPPAPPCATTGTCTSRTSAARLWRAQPSSNRWSADPAADAVTGGLAVHGRSVWLTNALRTRDGPVAGTGVLHSADGGDHFALEPQPIPGIACSYSPATDTVLWSYCSGGHFSYAYLSADAGAHFASTGPSEGPPTPNGYPNGSTLDAASPTTAAAASDLPGSPLIRTVDGGATWNSAQSPPDRSGTWSLIGFTTPEIGYALWEHYGATYPTSTAQLWQTTDAGATWSPVAALRRARDPARLACRRRLASAAVQAGCGGEEPAGPSCSMLGLSPWTKPGIVISSKGDP